MRPRLRIGLAGALLLALLIYCGLRFEVTNSITHFIAAGDDARLAGLAGRLADSELTRTSVLLLTATGSSAEERRAQATEAGRRLEARLKEDPEVAWVRGGWDSSHDAAYYDLYFPHRLHFLSAQPESELRERLSGAGLRRSAVELKRQLASSAAPLIKPLAPADPLLAYKSHLDQLQAGQGDVLTLADGRFVTAAGDAVILFASRHSPFQTTTQAPLLGRVSAHFEAVRQELGEQGSAISLQQSAVGRFAVQAQRRIRGDIMRISVLSTVGIVALFLLVFRSPRLVLLSMLPLACGVLLALSASLFAFGRIHGLTLAFGSSLIGICIDYPIHLFNHHALQARARRGASGSESAGADDVLREIRPGLLLGAGTTIVGFAGLAWTSFPGIREIAIFASVGIAGALAATLWLLPVLMPKQPRPTALHRYVVGRVAALLRRLELRRRWLLVLPAAALLMCAFGLPRLEFVDDVAALTIRDPVLLAEEDLVRAKVSRMDAGRLVIAIAADDETALQRNDQVYERLRDLQKRGAVEDFRSLHDFLWSQELQRRNRRVIRDDVGLFDRFAAAFEAEGFRAGAFEEFERALGSDLPAPLRFEELQASPLGDLVRSFRTELSAQGDGSEVAEAVGIITMLRGVKDPAALEAALGDLTDVYYFDQGAMMAEIYARNRKQTLELTGLGLVAVFGMVFFRYRRLSAALAAFVPAVLGAASTFALLGLLGVPINLLHVVSMLLVLSMGVDYGVFLAESRWDLEGGTAITVLSLILACFSTVLAFGLLGMSMNPALQAIGVTTGIGVFLSLLLAPTTLISLRRGGRA